MSFVTLGQTSLLMLKGITVTRSQGPDDRSDARRAVRAASLILILGVKVAISLLLTEGVRGGLLRLKWGSKCLPVRIWSPTKVRIGVRQKSVRQIRTHSDNQIRTKEKLDTD